jgi:hypothetical protein
MLVVRLQHGFTLYILPNMAYHTACTMVGLAKMRAIHISQIIYSGTFGFHNSAGAGRSKVGKTQASDT